MCPTTSSHDDKRSLSTSGILADRGEYGVGPDVEEQVRRLTGQVGQYRAYERTRPDGRIIEIRHNPVPSGGFV